MPSLCPSRTILWLIATLAHKRFLPFWLSMHFMRLTFYRDIFCIYGVPLAGAGWREIFSPPLAKKIAVEASARHEAERIVSA